MRLALATLCLVLLAYSVRASDVTEEGNCRCVKGKCIRSGFGNELAEVLGTEACKCVSGKCVFPKSRHRRGACTGPICSLEENEEKKSKMDKKQMKKDKKKGKGDNKPTIVAPKLFDAAIEDPEDVVVEDVVVGDPMGPCTGPVCSLEENEEKKSKEEKKQKKMEKKKKKAIRKRGRWRRSR